MQQYNIIEYLHMLQSPLKITDKMTLVNQSGSGPNWSLFRDFLIEKASMNAKNFKTIYMYIYGTMATCITSRHPFPYTGSNVI